MLKICEYCGKEFEAKNSKQKFCCRECSHKSMSKKVEAICDCCGKTYLVKRDQYEKSESHYCSKECHDNAGRVTLICEYCGREYVTKKNVYERRGSRFCSHECAMKVVPFEQETNKEIVKCKRCGKEFEAHVSSEREFCSTECSYAWRVENPEIYAPIHEKHRQQGEDNFYSKFSEKRSDIELLSPYVNAKTKILCRCIEHNQEFLMLPSHIIEGKSGCTKCRKSKGEQKI